MFLYLLFSSLLATHALTPAQPLKPVSCYGYKQDSIVVEWTAYKFTEKTGVKGSHKKVTAKIIGVPQSVDEMIAATSFEVDALSVDTANPARDITLKDNFFKLIKSPKITGKILSLKDGTAKVEISMNGTTKAIDFKVASSDAKITATAGIDILDFGMSASLKKINEACYELHKGKDGVSKTWSTVDLSITAEPVQLCKKKG
ncbi:MAG: YceI family protein [Bdellovibrionaceae bacterium]|nr:YceI family protein [Pseudobdellovibrionaceae bacterium]